jgi:UDP-4-amino-4-deoxy-L-arabinose formyltransferase/UDP-glucuronic acid dehydrogenase (UDP-4-keto-hexauronic acid decarboxylating)
MEGGQHPKLLVLCTVSTGLDAIAEVHQRGYPIVGLVGLRPQGVDLDAISGYVDIAPFAQSIGVDFRYVETYSLKSERDRALLTNWDFDLVWVAGWQRLVPGWLIQQSRLGVIGGHGSPDGIAGGRGRSPQNWALLLGCSQFDLALFRITEGVDEGPIIAQRTFFYRPDDDIQVSYYRATLAMADMVCEILANPTRLEKLDHQPTQAFYYPQRKPEDGMADWYQSADVVARHCRALTSPYPGLRTIAGEVTVTIIRCQPFDDQLDGPPGNISHCFLSGDFLVNCIDGRLLVRSWSASDPNWGPRTGTQLSSVPFREQLKAIVDRHRAKYHEQVISKRIQLHVEGDSG